MTVSFDISAEKVKELKEISDCYAGASSVDRETNVIAELLEKIFESAVGIENEAERIQDIIASSGVGDDE